MGDEVLGDCNSSYITKIKAQTLLNKYLCNRFDNARPNQEYKPWFTTMHVGGT